MFVFFFVFSFQCFCLLPFFPQAAVVSIAKKKKNYNIIPPKIENKNKTRETAEKKKKVHDEVLLQVTSACSHQVVKLHEVNTALPCNSS